MGERHGSRLADLLDHLGTIPEVIGPVAPAVVGPLGDLLESELAVLYRPSRAERGWQLDLFAASAGAEQLRNATSEFLQRAPATYAIYDAARPQPEQRDRVVSIDPMRAPSGYHGSAIVRDLLAPQGLDRMYQSRVLVCDGPELLAWVGAFRRRPFRRMEADILSAVMGPLRRRLKLERQLAAGEQAGRALSAALDAICAPAFIVRAGGVEHANAAGRAHLERAGFPCREELSLLESGAGALVFELTGAGLPPLQVVVLRQSEWAIHGRLQTVATEWRLSPRQTEVLGLLAAGEPNKGIAAKLGCAEVTVEFHLTALFRRSRTQNRGELIARFWAWS